MLLFALFYVLMINLDKSKQFQILSRNLTFTRPEMAVFKEEKSPKNFRDLFENNATFVKLFISLELFYMFQLITSWMSKF